MLNFLAEKGIVLTQYDIQYIVKSIGGVMSDVAHVFSSLEAGTTRNWPRGTSLLPGISVEETITPMVTQCTKLIKHELEKAFDKGSKGDYKRYLRLWEMMQMFTEHESIPRWSLHYFHVYLIFLGN